ncbi:MAG: di-trans,poly-cis-decaprenylcistransferase [Ruminococcaceae bacterium]|nr:di-trans,poly-cis-decaprenylcistransferase [Oscillospiraceae bacterium]
MRLKKKDTQEVRIKHIAFIMDGNGRWATKRGLPREYGHRKGAEAFRKTMEYCGELGISATTFYVFSTENWKRPKKEVDALMKLLDEYLDECKETVMKKDDGIRFLFIGDKSIFLPALREKMEELEELTKYNSRIVNLAINYGGRDEIVNAFNVLIAEGKRKICEDDISNAIYTKASPPVDMIVRTGGDIRISNFLLWEAAYAELYFTNTLWPDFSKKDIDKAINEFNNRNRRFGGV